MFLICCDTLLRPCEADAAFVFVLCGCGDGFAVEDVFAGGDFGGGGRVGRSRVYVVESEDMQVEESVDCQDSVEEGGGGGGCCFRDYYFVCVGAVGF